MKNRLNYPAAFVGKLKYQSPTGVMCAMREVVRLRESCWKEKQMEPEKPEMLMEATSLLLKSFPVKTHC